jgi:hypothetical protein
MVCILDLVEVAGEEPQPSVVIVAKPICGRAQRVISLYLVEFHKPEICRCAAPTPKFLVRLVPDRVCTRGKLHDPISEAWPFGEASSQENRRSWTGVRKSVSGIRRRTQAHVSCAVENPD